MPETIGQIYVGVWDEKNEHELWRASNQPLQSDFLVVFDLGFGGVDPEMAEHFESTLLALSQGAVSRQDLSQYSWLFSTELSLKEVFNLLITHLGVEHHNYTALELATGVGFAFNAKRRAIYEISRRGRGI